MNGSNHAEGRVEFLYSESWRTVCGASWDLKDARVVCRMLGFDGALAASRSARFGQGSGDVLRVDCWGTEDSLADCSYFGASIPCGHHMDAGAVCYLGGMDLRLYLVNDCKVWNAHVFRIVLIFLKTSITFIKYSQYFRKSAPSINT